MASSSTIPNAGRIAKEDFAAYFAQFKETVDEIRGGTPQPNFMDLTEVVTSEEDGILTAWCWWSVPGTDIQGSGLLKVSDGGVISERLAHYTALPWLTIRLSAQRTRSGAGTARLCRMLSALPDAPSILA